MAAPQLRPLGEHLGTEAVGVDLSKLDDDAFAWIRGAFAEHPVLVFRDQRLGAGDIAAFGRRFGTNMMVRAPMPKAAAGSCMFNGTKTPQPVSKRHKAPHPAAI